MADRHGGCANVTLAIGYVLGLLIVGLVLFALDVMRVDVVALILLLALAIPGILTPSEALAGFGSETILTLITLFVLTEGVKRTGVVERLGLRLASFGSRRPVGFTRLLLVSATAVSCFVSNTVTTAVFLPIVLGAAARAHVPASRVLMPLAFATILSGTVTLIGTSTNLIVSGELPRYGLAPLGFFEMAPIGGIVAFVGLAYLIFVAPRVIPARAGQEPPASKPSRTYVTEVLVTRRSPLVGKTLSQIRLSDVMDLIVIGIRRSTRRIMRLADGDELREGDELVLEGPAADILSVKDIAGIEIKPERKHAAPDPKSDATRMREAMVLPRSPFVGRTLSDLRFAHTTGLAVLAIHTAGRRRGVQKLSRWTLRPSDVLLLQGAPDDFDRLKPDELLLLEDRSAHHPRSVKGVLAAAIFLASLVLGAAGVLPLPLAFLIGVLALVLTRCLTAEEAYASIDWRLLVLIGSMLAFGVAMQKSGASDLVASLMIRHVSPLGSLAVMGAFFVLTVVLSQPMSNQAAALIVLPVAIHSAQQLGIDPRTFVITVTIAASCSFLTPLEPACVLVYGPGRYRFLDFLRVGAPLTALVFVACMVLIPIFWPVTSVG